MKFFIVLIIILCSFNLSAQSLELGIMAGISKYEGDLAPTSYWTNFAHLNQAFGGIGRYHFSNYFAAKLGIYYGSISGDDASARDSGRRLRGLSFRSDFYELSLTGELHVLGYYFENEIRRLSPYLFLGVGLMKYNPKAEYNDRWVELQPLGTEGQGLSEYPDRDFYALTRAVYPMGLGVKYNVNNVLTIGIEVGTRLTLTDYLDDVSATYVDTDKLLEARGAVAAALSNRSGQDFPSGFQRGDNKDNDWYSMAGIIVAYRLAGNRNGGLGGQANHNTKCYAF